MKSSTGGKKLCGIVEAPVSGDAQPAKIARRARCIDIAASSDGTCGVSYALVHNYPWLATFQKGCDCLLYIRFCIDKYIAILEKFKKPTSVQPTSNSPLSIR